MAVMRLSRKRTQFRPSGWGQLPLALREKVGCAMVKYLQRDKYLNYQMQGHGRVLGDPSLARFKFAALICHGQVCA